MQPPKDDAAIVGAVRLLSVLIAALAMDLAGRKVLLFISGECGWVACACFCSFSCCPRGGSVSGAWVTAVLPGGLGSPRRLAQQGWTSRKACWGSQERARRL